MKNKYEVRGEVTAIIINSEKYGRQEALISTSDLVKMDEIKGTWHLSRSGKSNHIYVKTTVLGRGYYYPEDRKHISLHRFVTDAQDGFAVDHINHDTFDNTKSNLRMCTIAENNQNRKGAQYNNKVGIRGVYWDKEKSKWAAQAYLGRKYLHGGYHDELHEAEKAAIKLRTQHLPFSSDAGMG